MKACSWCDRRLATEPPGASAAPVSHGICPSCLQARLAALQARPAPAAPAATAAGV